MLPFWLLFAVFAIGAFFESVRSRRQPALPILGIAMVGVALMIGLRYKVGADWYAYLWMFRYAEFASMERLLSIGDPGYELLNWMIHQVDGDIWLVNLVCGAIFAWGLFRFASSQANPWLATLVAVPYLIMVVAMGYTRQAVAIGILMAGLASYSRSGSVLRFAIYVAVAALFHRTAVVAIPLVAFATPRNTLINLLVAVAAGYLLYDVFLAESLEHFMEGYVERGYSSQGAGVRVAMNTVPAVLFLAFSRRFGFSDTQRQLWRNFSLAALVLLVLLIVTPSSTAVDRISLYIIPLQLAVLSNVTATFTSKSFGYTLVASYCLAVQFTWLNYAVHSKYWVPYRLYPFGDRAV